MIDSAAMLALALPDSLGPYASCSPSDSWSAGTATARRSNWIVAFGIVVILAAIGLLQLAIATHNGRAPTGF